MAGKHIKINDMKAQNIHDTKKWKKKKHPAAGCGNAKCMIFHSDKVAKIPDRKTLRQNSKDKTPQP